jgi:hypothetical protein
MTEQVFALESGKKIVVTVTECNGGYQILHGEEGVTGKYITCRCGSKTITVYCPSGNGLCYCDPPGDSPRVVCS